MKAVKIVKDCEVVCIEVMSDEFIFAMIGSNYTQEQLKMLAFYQHFTSSYGGSYQAVEMNVATIALVDGTEVEVK